MKVLIITYYWPPSGGSGVQRWMYFAKYLQEFGIEPIVITVDEKQASYPSLDFSLNKNVENIEVHKTKTLELIRFYSFLKSGNSKKSIPQGNVGNAKKTFFDKIATKIRANYFIPDARIGWNYYAYKEAKKVIENNKIDLVITTGPPHSTHLVGLKLKKNFNIKWIADFRDPWTEIYYNDIFKRSKKKTEKDKNLEFEVLNSCDLVLTIGPSMKDLLAKKVSVNKIEFIYNGFDENLLENFEMQKNDKFVISYVGLLTSNYPYKSLLKALKKIKSTEIIFKFTGKIEQIIIDEFSQLNNIELIVNGVKSHKEAFDIMRNSDLNVLLLPYQIDSKIMITGKVFEYLATGKPILSIGAIDSDAVKIIKEESKISACFEKEEINLIQKFIENQFKNRSFSVKNSDFNFSRKKLTKQLSELIKKV